MPDNMLPPNDPKRDSDFIENVVHNVKHVISEITKQEQITEINKIFQLLKKHRISKWNGLWDIGLFLTCSLLVRKYKVSPLELQNIYDLWSHFPRPLINIFHGPYVVPEFWQPYLKDETVFEYFYNYFTRWCEQSKILTWDNFAEDLQVFFTRQPIVLTPSQYELLTTIVRFQTDSTAFISEKINRSKQSISKDKKTLYAKRVLHKSLWVNFFKLGLKQRTLVLVHEPMHGARALVNPQSPWLFSQMTAYMFSRYSILTLIVPQNQEIDKYIYTMKEQFLNTADVKEIYDFEPDFSKRPPLVTVNFSFFNPKEGTWSFEIGYPLTSARLIQPHPETIYLQSPESAELPSTATNTNNYRFSQETMQALALFYEKGKLSIRELEKEMNISFHKARTIHQDLSTSNLVSERFYATLGSMLNTIFVLVNAPTNIIEQLRVFFTNFPEQQVFDVKGEFTGLQGYARIPPQYIQDTIIAIEKIVRPNPLLAMPVIGGQDIQWRIPYERWNEETQSWIVEDHDFALFDEHES